jgi:3-hydroxyacyl-CoA dehydrogenase
MPVSEGTALGTQLAAPAPETSFSSTVAARIDANIGFIYIDNPPVNALSHSVRSGLSAAVRTFSDAPGVQAIIVIGKGQTFPAGADIREFGRPIEEPALNAVNLSIEACRKPVIAAIHGTALGGGLEIALACHFRIALASARLGLPEVKLGVIPGAGGTQRLPRLIGIEQALRAIATSRILDAAEALQLGLVDAIVADDLHAHAIRFAQQVIAEGRPLRLVRDLQDKLAPASAGVFDEFESNLPARLRNRLAATRAIRSVRNAAALPFDEGLRKEREYVEECKASPQSAALQYVFFAERAAFKFDGYIAGALAGPEPLVGIAGAGALRTPLAAALLIGGCRVLLFDQNARALSDASSAIVERLERLSSKGRIASRQELQSFTAALEVTSEAASLRHCTAVIEVEPDTLSSKSAIVGALSAQVGEKTALITTTALLSVDEIAAASRRPANVVGMHFFIPASTMRQVEIVRADRSSNLAASIAVELSRRLEKIPVVSRDCDGFVGDRTLRAYLKEAIAILEEGVPAAHIDAALRDFGMAHGPFELCDFIGLDLAQRILDGRSGPGETGTKLIDLQRAGTPNGMPAHAGTSIPKILAAAIVERCLLAAAAEAKRLVAEGIVSRPSDVDIVWVNGLGFPEHCGGPLFWATQTTASVQR